MHAKKDRLYTAELFKHCGLQCEIWLCFKPSFGGYYCGYVYFGTYTPSKADISSIKSKFSDKITFKNGKKIGIDTAHYHNLRYCFNVKNAKNNFVAWKDFNFAKSKVCELAELIEWQCIEIPF